MPLVVDARGLACPRPRQMTIEAIHSARQGDVIVVIVDTVAGRDSIIRLLKAFQLPYKLEKKAKHHEIRITREKLWLEK
jgi:TusA-related sulfurtransferase